MQHKKPPLAVIETELNPSFVSSCIAQHLNEVKTELLYLLLKGNDKVTLTTDIDEQGKVHTIYTYITEI